MLNNNPAQKQQKPANNSHNNPAQNTQLSDFRNIVSVLSICVNTEGDFNLNFNLNFNLVLEIIEIIASNINLVDKAIAIVRQIIDYSSQIIFSLVGSLLIFFTSSFPLIICVC